MRAVIIVPWRGGDPAREANWTYARRWWERFGWEVVQVDDDHDAPFNRAWALNEGARRAGDPAPWDVAMFIDADVVEDTDEQVLQAVIAAWETGRFVVAHTEGRDLNPQATEWLLNGQPNFDWRKHTAGNRPRCLSRVNVMRADLFEELGGWDERFRGWGHEDVAMYAAAEQLSGPIMQMPGCSWHLYHEPMLAKSKATDEWQAGKALADRYLSAAKLGPAAVHEILDERTPDERYEPPFPTPMPEPVHCVTDLVVMTSGRKEYLAETLASAAEHLKGEIAHRVMFDDSGDPLYAKYLAATYPDFTIIHHDANLGYSVATQRAREFIRSNSGSPYVFWLEDDFTFNRDVSLDEMATLLTDPDLAQVVLLRQAWKAEIAAGGIVQQHPESYKLTTYRGIRYLKHTRFFSSNPNLARRELFDIPWPEGAHTESRFGRGLVEQGWYFGFLHWNEELVTHIGEVRGGHGY